VNRRAIRQDERDSKKLPTAEGVLEADADKWMREHRHDWNKDPEHMDVQDWARQRYLTTSEVVTDTRAEPKFAGRHSDPAHARGLNVTADALTTPADPNDPTHAWDDRDGLATEWPEPISQILTQHSTRGGRKVGAKDKKPRKKRGSRRPT